MSSISLIFSTRYATEREREVDTLFCTRVSPSSAKRACSNSAKNMNPPPQYDPDSPPRSPNHVPTTRYIGAIDWLRSHNPSIARAGSDPSAVQRPLPPPAGMATPYHVSKKFSQFRLGSNTTEGHPPTGGDGGRARAGELYPPIIDDRPNYPATIH